MQLLSVIKQKTRLCKVQNENGGSFEVLSDETELRHTERCCRINQRYVSKKMRPERVQNLTNAAQRAIIDMFTVGSIRDASNTR